jgi:hypothetical protein
MDGPGSLKNSFPTTSTSWGNHYTDSLRDHLRSAPREKLLQELLLLVLKLARRVPIILFIIMAMGK